MEDCTIGSWRGHFISPKRLFVLQTFVQPESWENYVLCILSVSPCVQIYFCTVCELGISNTKFGSSCFVTQNLDLRMTISFPNEGNNCVVENSHYLT